MRMDSEWTQNGLILSFILSSDVFRWPKDAKGTSH